MTNNVVALSVVMYDCGPGQKADRLGRARGRHDRAEATGLGLKLQATLNVERRGHPDQLKALCAGSVLLFWGAAARGRQWVSRCRRGR